MTLGYPKTMLPLRKLVLLSVLLFAICSAILLSQLQIDKTRNRYNKIEDMKYIPSGQFLKGAALAYDELLADILWIKALIYFGDHYESDKSYKWLYHLLDIVVTLDPHFQYAYEFGGIALALWTREVDQSIKLLKKGMNNIPTTHERYWAIPFFLGFNYMYYKKDYAVAARYLEESSRYPGHPRYLPFLVARLYANAKDPEIAIKFLTEIYDSTENEGARKDLMKRINEVVVEKDILLLERARDQFEIKTGSYPLRLSDLVRSGFLKEIPREPFGGKYIIKKNHSIQSSVVKERMKVFVN